MLAPVRRARYGQGVERTLEVLSDREAAALAARGDVDGYDMSLNARIMRLPPGERIRRAVTMRRRADRLRGIAVVTRER